MLSDRQGNPVTGATADAVEHFDAAVRAFNIYRGDPVALADTAIEDAPDFAMAHILKAYLYALATEPAATIEAASIVSASASSAKSERERSHISALESLLANNWTEAAIKLDHHNMRFPLDLIALQAGHLMDFYRANSRNLRNRIARVLPQWSEGTPGYSVVLGMHAFGLEEAGLYEQAEDVGREAVARDPLDCWAHHAVAHVMEMQGRAEDGIGWMQAREPYWTGDDNFFKVHNWWHKALYHLDLGQVDAVIALYDDRVRGDQSAVALDLVDASAMLWRLQLDGHDVDRRWDELAAKWDEHADGVLYPFNDWHAAMAYLGAGRVDRVDRLIDQYKSANSDRDECAQWAQSTGLPLIEGFRSFWTGDHGAAVERLHRARFIANSFGGSHAQRDIIDWTLTEAALRGGHADVARSLANERLAIKPHSPINRRFLQRATDTDRDAGVAVAA